MIFQIELSLPTGSGKYHLVNRLSKDLANLAIVSVSGNSKECLSQYKVTGIITRRQPGELYKNGSDMLTVSAMMNADLGRVADTFAAFVNEVESRRRVGQADAEYRVDTWENRDGHGVRVTHLPSGITEQETTSSSLGFTTRLYAMRQKLHKRVMWKVKVWERDRHISVDPMGYAKQTLAACEAWVRLSDRNYKATKILLSPDMYMRVREFAGSDFLNLPYLVDSQQVKPMLVKYG